MADIFLSYSRDDQAAARRFADGFEREGLSVWWDQSLRSGENYDQVTESALREAKAVVVLWSKKSVDSRWVRAEATTADRAGTLVPVMIEPCNRPIMFELKHTAELAHWKGDSNDKAWVSFLADVRAFMSNEAPPAEVATATTSTSRRTGGLRLAIAVLVALAAGVGLWALTHKRSGPADASPSVPAIAAADVSLAVLPFANMSSDPEQEYFSDGLTEEILNQLAQVRELRLIGRTSSFSFKGKNEDLRVIGEKLGVANLLEGSIRKDGSQLRITAKLINAKDGSQRWSQTYERELSKVFEVQEEIAMDVAEALSITLDVGVMSRAQGGTANLDAYDKYLRGRALISRFSPEDLSQGAQFLREAVKLDPAFDRGWLALVFALGPLRAYRPGESDAIGRELDEISARIEGSPSDAWWTQATRAMLFRYDYQWAKAEAASNAAMAAAPPSDVDVLAGHSFLIWGFGRVNEAIPILQRLVRLDPLAKPSSDNLASALEVAGRVKEADAEYARRRELTGEATSGENAALKRQWIKPDFDPVAVEATLRRLQREYPDDPILSSSFLRVMAGKVGDRAAAMQVISDSFKGLGNVNPGAWTVRAGYALAYGDKDLALASLRKAHVDLRFTFVPGIWSADPSIRADQRYKEILRDMGLVDYFRASGKWGDFCRPAGVEDFGCH